MARPKTTTPCASPGCDRIGNESRGLCKRHYRRAWRRGELPPLPSLAEQFWAKTRRDPATECLLWTGGLDLDGYGVFSPGHRRFGTARAPRVAWMLRRGPIPAGAMVLHRCDTPGCVNVEEHLFLGSNSENMLDSAEKRRHRCSRLSHCPKGHALEGYNLRTVTRGRTGGRPERRCRTCHNERMKLLKRKWRHQRTTAVAAEDQ